MKQSKIKCILASKTLACLLTAFISFGFGCNTDSSEVSELKAEIKVLTEQLEAKSDVPEEKKEEEKPELKEITLGNGNYVAGEDFEPGTYTITAVKGGGNVSSSNAYRGGINAIMGVKDDDFYEKEYKNIKLPKGTTLRINGVSIKLTPKN